VWNEIGPANYLVLNQRGVLGGRNDDPIFASNLEAAAPPHEVIDNTIVIGLIGQLQNRHTGLHDGLTLRSLPYQFYCKSISITTEMERVGSEPDVR
jgi:hypothetical protein